MAGKSIKEKLLAEKRRRERAPRPVPVLATPVSRPRWREITEGYEPLLRSIESALATVYQQMPENVDDAAALRALRGSVFQQRPEDSAAGFMFDQLERAADVHRRSEVWSDALRVVIESVHTHSKLAPGERNYLDFILPFLNSTPALDYENDVILEHIPASRKLSPNEHT